MQSIQFECERKFKSKSRKKEIKNQFVGWQKALHIYLYLFVVVSWTRFSTIFYYAINDHVFVSEQSLFMFFFYGKIITDFCPSVFSILQFTLVWLLPVINRNWRRGNARIYWYMNMKKTFDFQPPSVFIRLKYCAQSDTSHARWNRFECGRKFKWNQ